MSLRERVGVIWCGTVTILIGWFNVDYMAGWGAGLSVDVGPVTIQYSFIWGMVAVIIDIGMILALAAMARWTREDEQLLWLGAAFLFAMFTAFSGHSFYRSLETTVGSKQEMTERADDAYRDAENTVRSTQSLLITLRSEQVRPPSVDISKLRAELAAISPSEKTRYDRVSNQIAKIEQSEKSRLEAIEKQISDAEKRLKEARDKMDWAPVARKSSKIAGFELYITIGVMLADVIGWTVFVGFGQNGQRKTPAPQDVAGNSMKVPAKPAEPTPPNEPKKARDSNEFQEKSHDFPVLVVDNQPSGRTKAALTDEIRESVLKAKKAGKKQKDIAAEFGLSESSVSRILQQQATVLGRMKRV